jgi:suppressor of ftsI/bilirubin oxidase
MPDAIRRTFLRACAGAAVAGLLWPARGESPGPSDFCAAPAGTRLPVGGDGGWFARIPVAAGNMTWRAGPVPPGPMPWSLAYAVSAGSRRALNPTLVANAGDRVRVELVNDLADEPTIVHWHGLANATANDGAGFVLAAPGERYVYDFTVRNRAGLYWYHPHPHGLAAGQAYRGLFGLIEVSDAEDRALRRALDLVPGASELTLVLQDRRDVAYAPDALDRHRGLLGGRPYVNGVAEPWVDVATRIYRLRILNASNARTYRLALRDGRGKPVRFTLIGTDGGLLAEPVECGECFLASAERVDLLVDLRSFRPGDTVTLETRPFDPMHDRFRPVADTETTDARMPGHAASASPASPPAGSDVVHAAWPDGGARDLATLRVRERVAYRREMPKRLSALAQLEGTDREDRDFRLGFNKGRWRINDKVFAMGETAVEVARGARESWLIRNYHSSMPHAMHLHGVHFQVLERETSPDAVASLAVDRHGRLATDLGWKDTVLVWPGESVRLAVDFALPFDGPQTYLFHCHNLEHEDAGMMLGVRVA